MIGRQQFDIEVTGADAANRALAESKRRFDDVGVAGQAAGPKLRSLEDGLERVTGPAGKVLRVFNDVGDVFRLVTAGLAGGALFGGLQDIAEALGTLADKAGFTATRVEYLASTGRTLDADLVKRAQGINDLSDGMDRYARSLGVAAGAQLTFAERQAALRSIASGETKTREGTTKEAEEITNGLAAMRERLRLYNLAPERFASEDVGARQRGGLRRLLTEDIAAAEKRLQELQRQELALLGRRGANPWLESVQDMGREYAIRAGQMVTNVVSDVRGMAQRGADAIQREFDKVKPKVGKVAPPAQLPTGGGLYPTMPGEFTDQDAASATADRKAQQQAASDLLTSSRQQHEMMAAHMQAAALAREEAAAAERAASAMAAMGDSFKSSFQGVAETALDAGGFVVGAVQQMSAAFGQAMTNFIIAGEAGSGGIRKIAGNVLASLSAQAFGYAFMLEALAAASALTGVLAFAAPGVAAAGGIMAGAGVALGVTARMLGAEPIGGKGGRSGGGGGGAASAAGTNPYQPQGAGPTQVTVIIGSEVVTRGVHVEERRQAMRGGISEPRRAA